MNNTRIRLQGRRRERRPCSWRVPLVVLALGIGVGCSADADRLQLPQGDALRGEQAFADLQCTTCHTVAGVADLPAPVAVPPVPVVLGGIVGREPTDAELVTSIISPDHRLARGYPVALIASGGRSRMGDYADTMTVRQLSDVVAFLQSRYQVVRGPSAP